MCAFFVCLQVQNGGADGSLVWMSSRWSRTSTPSPSTSGATVNRQDTFELSLLFTMHTDNFTFHRSASFRHPQRVYNVVPGDYTHDGKLDVRVMAQGTSIRQLSLSIYPPCPTVVSVSLSDSCLAPFLKNWIDMNPIGLPPSPLPQGPQLIPFDGDDQMRIDLLGLQQGSSQLKMWKNIWNATDPSGPLYEV